nr:hypothetical protein [Tanacetum cinerariifolium]
MMTARKRFRPLPTYRLSVRHSVDYSSSDHFSSDHSLRDSSSSSSTETSSDSSADVLSDSASSQKSHLCVLLSDPCERVLANKSKGFCQLGFSSIGTWGVGGNGNANGNGGGNGYNFRGFMPAREYTYQDFLNFQHLSFNETKGVVGLTRWFEKMEMVFNISNCPEKYQVKIEATYAVSWAELMKLMTKVYCPRNEVQKMETELWNLAVKGNDMTAYTRRFQELVLLCARMVPNEEDKVERSAENNRRLENNPRDIQGQQPVFKRQNVGGQNVARAYTAMNNEKKGDCNVTVTPNTQRALVGNQPSIILYECGRPEHFRKDCPKLRNQNRRNQTGKRMGTRLETRMEGIKLQQGLTPLEEEVQTLIPMLSWVRSFSITVMLLCYLIRVPIGVLCRLPLVPC